MLNKAAEKVTRSASEGILDSTRWRFVLLILHTRLQMDFFSSLLVSYFHNDNGSVKFDFVDANGKVKAETYSPRHR